MLITPRHKRSFSSTRVDKSSALLTCPTLSDSDFYGDTFRIRRLYLTIYEGQKLFHGFLKFHITMSPIIPHEASANTNRNSISSECFPLTFILTNRNIPPLALQEQTDSCWLKRRRNTTPRWISELTARFIDTGWRYLVLFAAIEYVARELQTVFRNWIEANWIQPESI